jgi:hypothetical protein
MPDLKMTPARIALLRAVADPKTEVYAALGSNLRVTWADADVYVKPEFRAAKKVTKRAEELEAAKLIKRAPAGVRYHQPRHYSLTEAGAKVLAELDQE